MYNESNKQDIISDFVKHEQILIMDGRKQNFADILKKHKNVKFTSTEKIWVTQEGHPTLDFHLGQDYIAERKGGSLGLLMY